MTSTTRRRAKAREEPTLFDAEWEEFRKALYERRRLKGVNLRKAEAVRRSACAPPPTLLEAIERHLRERPRVRRDTLTPPHTSTSGSPSGSPVSAPKCAATSDAIAQLAAIFAADPVLAELGEVAALTPEERFERYGWLVHVPYDLASKVPPQLLADDYRWDIPRWALKRKYDVLREDRFLDIVDLRLDQGRADKLAADRRYAAKPSTKASRAMHPDELGLPAEQKSHLKKLRARLANSKDILRNVEGMPAATPAKVTTAKAYVDSAVVAIRRARTEYGLPELEVAPR